MRKLGLYLILLLGLTACATEIEQSHRQNIQRIGVYSGMNEVMHHTSVGILVYNVTTGDVSVPHWQVREYSEQSMLQQLGARAGQIRVPMNVRQQASGMRYGGIVQADLGPYDQVLVAARQQGFDTAVLLFPESHYAAEMLAPGYGVYQRSNYLGGADHCAYAAFRLEAFDTATKEKIGQSWSGEVKLRRASGTNDSFCSSISVPWKEIRGGGYTDAELDLIRRSVMTKVNAGIAFALGEMGLRGQ